MKRHGGVGTWIIVLAVGFLAYQYLTNPSFFNQLSPTHSSQPTGNVTMVAAGQGTYTIAFWNLQAFGTAATGDAIKFDAYANALDDYDIIGVEEIRDVTGAAWQAVCDRMASHGYKCAVGEREGSTQVKEQYGLLYRKGRLLTSRRAYGSFERPPTVFTMEFGNKTYNIAIVHIKPDAVETELAQLQLSAAQLASERPTIVGGDFNADCSYYTTPFHSLPQGFNLYIADSMDTTSGASDCAYDRILATADIGVIRSNIGTATVSDHYPVFIEAVL